MQFTIFDSTIVSARSFEDEVVVAHFGTGMYYSLVGSAAAIWNGLMAGVPLAQVVAALTPLAGAEAATLAVDTDTFVASLVDAELIKPAEGLASSDWTPDAPAGTWEPPRAESFSDMQDLLLLDPVHDTSEAGWPYVVTA